MKFATEFASKNPNAIVDIQVGKMGEDQQNVVRVKFNNQVTKYEDLLKYFFTLHDPTRNEEDAWSVSAIFVDNQEQRKASMKVIKEVDRLIYYN